MIKFFRLFEKLVAILVCLPGIVIVLRFLKWYCKQYKGQEKPDNV